MNIEKIVDEVVEWFGEASPEMQNQFKQSTIDELISYHSSLGMSIRNHFKLWEQKWIPEIVDGVDTSPNHPDAISMRIIEQVWERIHNADKSRI